MNTLGLPYSWQANCVAATPYDKSTPPGPVGLPEHIQINFGAENPTQSAARRSGDLPHPQAGLHQSVDGCG